MADDEEEYFEIVDYTAASPLERLASDIEHVLIEWNVKSFPWTKSKQAPIIFGDAEFLLTLHYHTPYPGTPLPSQDSLSPTNSLPLSHPNPLHRWSGLRTLLTFIPTRTTLDLSTSKLLLSACILALRHLNCKLPVFVPIGPAWKNMYAGATASFRSDVPYTLRKRRWRMVHAPYVPPQYADIAGLRGFLDTFSAGFDGGRSEEWKLLCVLSYERLIEDVDIEWRETISASAIEDDDEGEEEEEDDGSEVILLPFGHHCHPIKSINLEAMFPVSRANISHLDLDFWDAELWRLSVELRVDGKLHPGLLTSILKRVVEAWHETEHSPTTDSKTSTLRDEHQKSFIDVDDIDDLIQALLQSDPPTPPIPKSPKELPSITHLQSQSHSTYLLPPGSLLWNLSLRLLDAASPESSSLRFDAGIVPLLRGLWKELCREFKICWRLGMRIPGAWAGTEGVELQWTLAHQKLQMLNWCIEQRREAGGYEHTTGEGDSDETVSVHRSRRKREVSSDQSSVSKEGVGRAAFPDMEHIGIKSLSKRIKSSINEFTSAAASAATTKTEGESNSTLVRLFDRLTTSHTEDGANKGSNDDRPPHIPQLPPPQRVGGPPTHGNRPPVLEATSWSSDRSWEDLKRREYGSSTSFHQQQQPPHHHVGSLGTQSFGSYEDPIPDLGLDHSSSTSYKSLMDDSPSSVKSNHNSSPEDVFFDTMELVLDPLDQSFPINHAPRHPPPLTRELSDASWETPSRPTTSDSFIRIPSSSYTRSGHKSPLPDFYLLSDPSTPIYEPHLQHPGPMTEDMIAEWQAQLAALGTSPAAAMKRMRMQSRQLKSDVQAFKAANPGAIMEDFVRWYSPRDFVVEEKECRGALSGRMREPGNLWAEVWQTSPPLAAKQQHPLFDVERVAREVLSYLSSLSVHQLLSILLPTMTLLAYQTLATHPIVARIPTVSAAIRHLVPSLLNSDIAGFMETFEEAEKEVGVAVGIQSKIGNAGDMALTQRLLESAAASTALDSAHGGTGVVEPVYIVGMRKPDMGDKEARRVARAVDHEGALANPTAREYIFTRQYLPLHQSSSSSSSPSQPPTARSKPQPSSPSPTPPPAPSLDNPDDTLPSERAAHSKDEEEETVIYNQTRIYALLKGGEFRVVLSGQE